MSGPRRRFRRAVLAAAALTAACQPLPHPFAEDRPPAALLSVRDSAGVSVAPIEGEPSATATKLPAAVASALLQREIPASDKTTSLGSYLLYGRIEKARSRDGKVTVTAHWRLQNAAGEPVGERTSRLDAAAREWDAGDDQAIARLATASVAEIAPMLEEEAPVEAAGGGGRTRIAIRPVSGAPGDGADSLSKAIANVLKRADLTVLDDVNAKADLYLDGEVTVAPVKPDKQHVKVVWHVRRADGAEIGTVGQENDVPKGLLDGPWGDVAYSVAIAAADGLAQLIARGAPEGKS
jgi:hypothetical protein